MKKALALFLGLVLAAGLCACGQKTEKSSSSIISFVEETADPSVVRANYDKALSYINSVMDSEGMTESDQDDDGGQNLFHYWGYDNETENSDFPMDITLDGTLITIGTTTAGDLRDAGLKLSISEETVEADNTGGFTVDKGNAFVNLAATNNTGKSESIYTLPLTEITTTGGDQGIPFTYQGLTEGADLKAVLDALGKPNSTVTLSSGLTGADITVEYFRDEVIDGKNISNNLSVYLTYDAEKNTASLLNLILQQTVM